MELDKIALFSLVKKRLAWLAQRQEVLAKNIANADTLPRSPDDQPYRRKVVTFKTELDRATGVESARVDQVRPDTSKFHKRHDPNCPAANPRGCVPAPNVKPLIEMMDIGEAQRSYEANLNVIQAAKSMLSQTIGILR